MSWTLLRAPADWDAHKKQMAGTMRVPEDWLKWGNGPKSYPCLVCSLLPQTSPDERGNKHEHRINSAYVYEGDAEILLRAAGRAPRDPDAPPTPNQQDFNKWVSAQLMTIAYFMVETGLCAPGVGKTAEDRKKANEVAFEDKMSEMRELVDQFHGDKRAEVRKGLAGYAATVLETLDPPK